MKAPVIQEDQSELETTNDSNASSRFLYGVGIGAGAVAGIVIAPGLLSAAGSIVGGVAAKSVASGVKSILVEGAMSGLITLAGSAGTVGLGVASTAAAGTVGAAISAASMKATKVFVKEFTSQLQKGITKQTLSNGVRKRSHRRTHLTNRRAICYISDTAYCEDKEWSASAGKYYSWNACTQRKPRACDWMFG